LPRIDRGSRDAGQSALLHVAIESPASIHPCRITAG
jgi:hypothetical protein